MIKLKIISLFIYLIYKIINKTFFNNKYFIIIFIFIFKLKL